MSSILKRVWEALGKSTSFFSRSIRYLSRKISRGDIVWFLCVSSSVALSVLIRLLPLNWGFSLSEFDPYFHYDVTRFVAEKGFSAFYTTPPSDWTRYWYPYGRNVPRSSFLGLPFAGAASYFFVSALGISVSVLDVCILFPVVMAAATCIVAYFLGKDIGGKAVGLFFSLLLAVNPAYIGRTALGFYDDETVGILAMLLTSLFFLRSLEPKKSTRTSIGYAVVAGLSLGYLCLSWGASLYILGLLPLFTFALIILRKASRRLIVSYSTVFLVWGVLIWAFATKSGYTINSFLTSFEFLAAMGVLLLLIMFEAAKSVKTNRARIALVIGSFIAIGLAGYLLWQYNYISLPAARFISVLNPFERFNQPIIESVSEHRPGTWSAIYYEFGVLVFLALLGLYFAARNLTNQNVFLIVYTLTSLYFAGSMIRLAVVLAPALCALGSLAIVEALKPFVDIAMERPFTRRRVRFAPVRPVGKGFSLSFVIVLFLLLSLTLVKGVEAGYMPTTIASSSMPVRANIDDWQEALGWMRESLPSDAVVVSWWDYGYWISVGANKSTLADNGTLNTTQIAQIGRMFMSNETQALTILKNFKATHVVVFTTIGLSLLAGQIILYGDEVKWTWMAEIAGLNTAELSDKSITEQLGFSGFYIPKVDTVLTKLMVYGALLDTTIQSTLYNAGVPIYDILSQVEPAYFKPVFISSNRIVFVYEVIYET
nr:STT3 domain-containing protein [Candidatus Njordarchaeum guaymaensis]